MALLCLAIPMVPALAGRGSRVACLRCRIGDQAKGPEPAKSIVWSQKSPYETRSAKKFFQHRNLLHLQ